MKKTSGFWQRLTIKNKIIAFAATVFLIFVVTAVFDAWLVKTLVMDFNNILEDNAGSVQIVYALEAERDAFEQYIHRKTENNLAVLNDCIDATYKAVYSIPLDYEHLGEKRYAQLQAMRSCYEVYCTERDDILNGSTENKQYIAKLYQVYDMQDYLHQYAQTFMSTTLEEGNVRYGELLPAVVNVPVIAIVLSAVLFILLMRLARMMNRTIIGPVINLSNASRKIAANDFFIDDVKTENDDEIGDLVKAFNKMKYATGVYIMALEERREALDRLHAQEIRNLEVEKQLETVNLALLKSQINPHFLFNTLNVIGGMANLEDAETTEKMIEALSSLFRYNLKNQDSEVILSQELKVARDYMYLQQMRFGSRVEYTVDCHVNAYKVMVPTFTFQPLLENAVIHGLTPKVEGGSIYISVVKDSDMLRIVVRDTGVGISEESLIELKSALKKNDTDKVGIGVGNIYRRIYSMYTNGSMDIDSIEGEWTTVTILLPYHTEV